jgi:hypothetical protein
MGQKIEFSVLLSRKHMDVGTLTVIIGALNLLPPSVGCSALSHRRSAASLFKAA